jgi:hypothetical protein
MGMGVPEGKQQVQVSSTGACSVTNNICLSVAAAT